MTTYRPKSIRALLNALAYAKANPSAECWAKVPGDFPIGSRDVLAMVDKAITAKCNRGLEIRGWREGSDADLRYDLTVVREYKQARIRRSGRNILRTSYMQKRYPDINNPPMDY